MHVQKCRLRRKWSNGITKYLGTCTSNVLVIWVFFIYALTAIDTRCAFAVDSLMHIITRAILISDGFRILSVRVDETVDVVSKCVPVFRSWPIAVIRFVTTTIRVYLKSESRSESNFFGFRAAGSNRMFFLF